MNQRSQRRERRQIEEEKWSTGQLRKWSTDKLHPDSRKTRKRSKSNGGFQYIFVKNNALKKSGKQELKILELLMWTDSVRLNDKEQHSSVGKSWRRNQESGIWETTGRWKPSSRFLEKKRLTPKHFKWNGRNQLTSHWQVEGSGTKSESLNITKHSYLLKDTMIEVEAEPLPVEGIPPSECWNLERNHIPKALS